MYTDFFISHSKETKSLLAIPLVQSLSALGFNVWIDRIRIVRARLKSLYLRALSASVTPDCIIIAFLYLPVVRSSKLIMRVISNAFGSRCEVNYSA